MIGILLIALFLAAGACAAGAQPNTPVTGKPLQGSSTVEKNPNSSLATFACGCFWCTEHDFREAPGVVNVVSGYAGGRGDHPTYEDYAEKGYVEAVQVFYDPRKVSYQELLDYFWRHIDPTDAGGQFVDRVPSTARSFTTTMKSRRPGGGIQRKLAAASGFK